MSHKPVIKRHTKLRAWWAAHMRFGWKDISATWLIDWN